MATLVILLTLVFLFFTIRALLIVLGWYKDPILRQFERYGEERIYSPFVAFVLWCTGFVFFAFIAYFGVTHILLVVLAMAVPFSYFYPILKRQVESKPDLFMMYPKWYGRLMQMTEREERRRIAYLWLRLPAGTRLLYNTRDEFFHRWTDLVLLTIA